MFQVSSIQLSTPPPVAQAIAFFAELGLQLEGRATIAGEWSGRVTGLRDQRVEIAMMRTPDGHSAIELSRFLTPPVVADHRNAPVNALGYLRIMFAVDDLDDTLARLGSTVRRSSTKWSSTKTCIGSATSEAQRAFSSDWPNRSANSQPVRHSRHSPPVSYTPSPITWLRGARSLGPSAAR